MIDFLPKNNSNLSERAGKPINQEALLRLLGASPESYRKVSSICAYLRKRESQKLTGDQTFGVVFAITPFCNLKCKHCAISARYRATEEKEGESALSTDNAVLLMNKIGAYADGKHSNVFFMFGGGEPTLRSDFLKLTKHAASTFGEKYVGFCTNGTFRYPEEVLSLANHVALLEVSLDGFEEYHNAWRYSMGKTSVENPYKRAMELVKAAVEFAPHKLEVSSILTTQNIDSLPSFARFLRDMGVTNYSVHRPMPIGRMKAQRSFIPDVTDFFRFFGSMVDVALEDEHFSVHLHHSLESIYSALFLGRDIHRLDLPMGSSRHSIGLSWDGSVHFDSWSTVPPFDSLSPGNLLDEGVELDDLWDTEENILNLVAQAKKANVRCRQCHINCTGGMRLAAMADTLYNCEEHSSISLGELVAAVSAIDPACPLAGVYKNNM